MNKENIPHYINDPIINKLNAPENKLYRPQIHFKRAFCIAFAVAIATFLVSYIIVWHLQNDEIFNTEKYSQLKLTITMYWKLQLIICLLTLRYILIWFVRIYQHYAKSETRLRCCYTPSCSEYAILALKKYGAIIGSIKAVRRLLRCGPPGGIDYP